MLEERQAQAKDFYTDRNESISVTSALTLQTLTGETLTYRKNEVIVGRNPVECDVFVDNKYASKKHMHFIFSDGKWLAEDLNSANGTWINGEKILPMQPVILKVGDQINIARYSVFYFQEKIVEDKADGNVRNEQNLSELEAITDSISKQDKNVLTSPSIDRLIDLLCETPLFIRAVIDDTKNQEERFQVVLFKPANDEIIPVFTRQQYAESFGTNGDVTKIEPENLMLTLAQLGEHIVINPNCENRLIIPKDVFKNVIFREFAKKYKAKVSVKKYEEKNDILGALICDYNMETNQSEKMRKIMTILSYMEENAAWVPCKARLSEEDCELIKNLKPGDVFEFENTRLKPDLLLQPSGKVLLPLFSQKDEAPVDYADNFSWINIPIVQCCELARRHLTCDGIIINAYTNSLSIPNDLVDIVLNHYLGKINLLNDKQMLQAVKRPNGGLRLELDNKHQRFISVFFENDRIRSYSIDEEAAEDSYYILSPYEAYRLSQLLEQQCHKGNFVDSLKQYFTEKSVNSLTRLMQENNIRFQQFHTIKHL